MNFTNATIEIEELLDKREAITKKTSNILAEAVKDRMEHGNINANLIKDIKNSIDKFPKEDQIDILTNVIVSLARVSNAKSNSQKSSDDDYFSDIFGSRKRR